VESLFAGNDNVSISRVGGDRYTYVFFQSPGVPSGELQVYCDFGLDFKVSRKDGTKTCGVRPPKLSRSFGRIRFENQNPPIPTAGRLTRQQETPCLVEIREPREPMPLFFSTTR
jgi:hypothetical protein